MRDFEFLTPAGVKEAALLLKKYGGRASLKAGGIDLLDLMKEGIAAPDAIVNLLPLKELQTITDDRPRG